MPQLAQLCKVVEYEVSWEDMTHTSGGHAHGNLRILVEKNLHSAPEAHE